MPQTGRVPVLLEQSLVQSVLNGLYQGAKHKGLKVVIRADGDIVVESKELRITLSTDSPGDRVTGLELYNERQCASLSAEQLRTMGLDKRAEDVVKEIRSRYSAFSHNLSENLVAFTRQYNNG